MTEDPPFAEGRTARHATTIQAALAGGRSMAAWTPRGSGQLQLTWEATGDSILSQVSQKMLLVSSPNTGEEFTSLLQLKLDSLHLL